MPYSLYPYIPNRVIYHRLYGDFTKLDLHQGNEELLTLLDQADPVLHIISDPRALVTYPMNVLELAKTLSLYRHPRMGWEIAISTSSTIRFLGEIVVQVASRGGTSTRFKMFPTLKDAKPFLKKIDPTLPDLPELAEDTGMPV